MAELGTRMTSHVIDLPIIFVRGVYILPAYPNYDISVHILHGGFATSGLTGKPPLSGST
jgi:hypothetical protein